MTSVTLSLFPLPLPGGCDFARFIFSPAFLLAPPRIPKAKQQLSDCETEHQDGAEHNRMAQSNMMDMDTEFCKLM